MRKWLKWIIISLIITAVIVSSVFIFKRDFDSTVNAASKNINNYTIDAALDTNQKKIIAKQTIEIKDKTCRPEIEDITIDIDSYDTIYVGFPIWWGIAPNVVKTFLDKIDLSNKKIITFCTSGSSPLIASDLT